MTEITIYTVQRVITPKVGKPQLWLFSAHYVMVLIISVKFRENISVFRLWCRQRFSRHEADMNFQTAITPKQGRPYLCFLCSACYLIVVNISLKFCKNISKGFQVTGQTDRQTAGWTDRQLSMAKAMCLLTLRERTKSPMECKSFLMKCQEEDI